MSKDLVYHSKWGKAIVEVSLSQYADNKNLFLELVATDGEYPEPYGNITVNLGEVPDYCGYIDTNNMPEMENFIMENDLGDYCGISKRSGFCEYPLYVFNVDRLRELCPDELADYEKARGIDSDKKEEEIEEKERCR